jgi:hypothetical protein
MKTYKLTNEELSVLRLLDYKPGTAQQIAFVLGWNIDYLNRTLRKLRSIKAVFGKRMKKGINLYDVTMDTYLTVIVPLEEGVSSDMIRFVVEEVKHVKMSIVFR